MHLPTGNDIDEDGMSVLAPSLRHLKRLKMLWLGGKDIEYQLM